MASPLMSRAALRQTSRLRISQSQTQWVRHASSNGQPRRSAARWAGLVAVGVASGAAVYAYPLVFKKEEAPSTPQFEQAELVFEKPRGKAASKEENRELVSSQHVQVKKSWEHPGVYVWGSNAGKVVAPDSNEAVIKTPRRLAYFDGQILRDLKLDRDFGVAVTENGDLVQWGVAFSKTETAPTVTLKGKNLVKVAISRDRIIALSSSGSVYSIPVASDDQAAGSSTKTNSSWIPFWSSSPAVNYRSLNPKDLGWGEKVVDVSSGLEHCLMLTSKGRVFSAASSSLDFPSKGQLGVPGLTWQTRPEGTYDQPHEVEKLRDSKIKSIATGDFHSLALASDGTVFSFGDNSAGQLGVQSDLGRPYADAPTPVPLSKLYSGTNFLPQVTSIAAGGQNSYFTIDATKVQGPVGGKEVVPARDLGKVAVDIWACGEGIKGSLGTGKWTHISSAPTKIKALSNLNEYDEKSKTVVPIRVAHLSVGSDHACAVMGNATNLSASGQASGNDTNFGADVLWWGGNESYQLGTGKRNNVNAPTYIGELDGGHGDAEGSHRFQITPRKTVRLGEGGTGRKASVEQRIECGRLVTAVYSGA
ncbi:regulator of chromosome condensation 1/beta-lactamase-inhibitor protein II [Podospora appendiculata]|uniref:Regulator of chromosome condensation 1/beta-lactamase-inhibitor protein II n=1 Tax=Podospora appendiculata TaxID=314037 RepID=A0AAE0XBN0_9PEZI|nr:regulator of chromosome condensation 1/beta-lactamase-inhibitor protein II [Podospora appendiculata]